MSDVVLLDGGMGMELLQRSANKTPRLWSADYLLSKPELVTTIHRDFIDAGACVVTTNSYSASYTRMAMVGMQDQVPMLQERACELAIKARDQSGQARVAIAGCLPPLNRTYRPDRVRNFEENLEEYARLAALQAPYVDLFICETMSTAQEARAAAQAATAHNKPVWVSWSLQDQAPRLRSGESIEEAYGALAGLPIGAVLVNCCPPESISQAMKSLVATGLAAGGYANGFVSIPLTFLPGKTREQLLSRTDLGPSEYAVFSNAWIDRGATIVGGCCEVGPSHIRTMRDQLLQRGHSIRSPIDPATHPD